jgi:hypothetical protein
MTAKTAFSPGEWKVVLEGPATAGMIVITAARGGMFRETIAMSEAQLTLHELSEGRCPAARRPMTPRRGARTVHW